jgi:hypothetical protein
MESAEDRQKESAEDRQKARSAGNRYVAQLLASPASAALSAPPGARFVDAAPVAPVINRTGLPDGLKSGLEHLGGVHLDDVRVHYDSPEPGRINALAFTRGRDIHVGPGQQAHLAHEGWHVVQQKQQRVRRTHWLDQVPVNDDAALEAEADRRGQQAQAQAHGGQSSRAGGPVIHSERPTVATVGSPAGEGVVQGVWADQAMLTERGLDPTRNLAASMQALAAFIGAGGGGLTEDEKAAFGFVAQVYNDEDIRPRLEEFLGTTFGPEFTWTSEALVRRVIELAEDPEDDVDHDEEDPGGTNVFEIRPQDIRWGDFSLGVPRERQILLELFVENILRNARGSEQLGPEHIGPLFARWYSSGVWTRAQVVREIRKILNPEAEEDDEPFVDRRPPSSGARRRKPPSSRMHPYSRPTEGDKSVVRLQRAPEEIVQRKANPNTVSFKAKYTTSLFGVFKNVGYLRDAKANIDFPNAQAHATRVWNDPSIAGSLVNLAQGSANPKRGFISAKQTVKIAPGGTRGDHFEIANYLSGLNPGGNARQSPPNKTWHHLTIAGYHMHLVDMKVHKKHCHVGGMNFWK